MEIKESLEKQFSIRKQYQGMPTKKFWLDAEFSSAEGWRWKHHYQHFNGNVGLLIYTLSNWFYCQHSCFSMALSFIHIFAEYTNWEGGVDSPPLGCLSTGCSSDYGIVAIPDVGLQWNAAEKNSKLPYICLSKCKQTYIWHQGIKVFRNRKRFQRLDRIAPSTINL